MVGLLAHGDDGVHEHGEVRPASHALDRIRRRGIAGIEMGGRRRGKVAAGGEADDADALRIATPSLSVGAHHANRPLGIEQRHKRPPARKPILQHNPGDAMRIQPLGDATTLRSRHETAVSAAGTDHSRGSVRLRGAINRHDNISLLKCPTSHGCLIRPESDLLRRQGFIRSRCRSWSGSQEQRRERLAPNLIPFLRRMAKVGHDFSRDSAVRLEQFGTKVEEGDAWHLAEFDQQFVKLDDVGTARMIGPLLAREYSHEDDPGVRRLGSQALHDGAEAFNNLRWRVLAGIGRIARVVRANVKHDDTRV